MEEYHKIQTVFSRDPDNHYKTLLEDDWSKPEFGYLRHALWEFTEKVDGMNIRIDYWGGDITYAGRTDNAQIPAPLLERLLEIGDTMYECDAISGPVTLYGEGFGGKIQKGGAYGEQDFMLFDVLAKGYWLDRVAIQGIAIGLGIQYAPVVGFGDLYQGIKIVKDGFDSVFGERPQAEGLVMRPATELKNRYSERVITKIKCKDFPK